MTVGPIMSPIMPSVPIKTASKPLVPDSLDILARAIKLYAVIQSEDQFAFEYATRKLNSRRKARLEDFLSALQDEELVEIAEAFVESVDQAYPKRFVELHAKPFI